MIEMIAMRVKINRVKCNYDIDITHGPLAFNHFKTSRNLAKYEEYLRKLIASDPVFKEGLRQLAGKTLGCTCNVEDVCHGDIIFKLIEEVL